MKSFLFLALGLSALVEYRFGQSYGYFYYDFSLNQYHGLNCLNIQSRMTDKGLYLATTQTLQKCNFTPVNYFIEILKP